VPRAEPVYRCGMHRPALVAIALSVVACKPQLSKEQRAEVNKTVEEAKKTALEREKERQEAITTAKGKITSRKDLGACKHEFSTSMLEHKEDAFGKKTPLNPFFFEVMLDIDRVNLIKTPDDAATKKGAGLSNFDRDARSLDSDNEPSAVNRAKDLMKAWEPELDVIVDKFIAPKVAGDKTFDSGIAMGRAYVYSYADKKIVCASVFLVENSDSVTVELLPSGGLAPGQAENLETDLYAQAIVGAKKNLAMAGPIEAEDVEPVASASGAKPKTPPKSVPSAAPSLTPKKVRVLE